jgi:hypothetical protein
LIYHGVHFHPLTLSERTPLKIVFKEQSSGGYGMKDQQETVDEKYWDGEFATYDEWAATGPQPPYRSATFLDAQGRRCITQQDFARAREDRAFPVRYYWSTPDAENADRYDWIELNGCLIIPDMIPQVGLAISPEHESPNSEVPAFPVPGLPFTPRLAAQTGAVFGNLAEKSLANRNRDYREDQ